tara:strand:+ start:8948 stop:10081 length:1134 start_codon:yes stop_codon:yes gene_type:complete
VKAKRKILLSLSILAGLNCLAQSFQFEIHEIGRHGNKMGQTSLVDVDKDDDLDWVYGARGQMNWFEYQSADQWVFHNIGEGASTDVGGCAIDVNEDGWMDFFVGTGWYQNSGEPKTKGFTTIPDVGGLFCHDNVATDVDGDGVLDIVALSNHPTNPHMVWYRKPEDPSSKWDSIYIAEGIHGGIDPMGYGDLDSDGDMDLVRGDVWFENANSLGTRWIPHKELIPKNGSRPDKYGLCLKSWVIDLDQDGDLDIIQTEADTPDGRVFWFENDDLNWINHGITAESTNQDFHSLVVADLDNDGDVDVFSSGGPLSIDTMKAFIWENLDGYGGAWKEHLISEDIQGHEAVGGDVDGDGDIDICTKPWNGDLHLFLENKLK